MLEGLLLALALWGGPALVAWLIMGPVKLGQRLRHH